MSIFIALYKEIFSKKMSQRAGAIQRVLHDKISQYVDNILFLPFLMWLNDPNATGSSSGELKDFFLKSKLYFCVYYCLIILYDVAINV